MKLPLSAFYYLNFRLNVLIVLGWKELAHKFIITTCNFQSRHFVELPFVQLFLSLFLPFVYSLPLSSLWHLCLYGKFNENGQRVKCFRCLLSMTNITYNEKPKPIRQNIKTPSPRQTRVKKRKEGGEGRGRASECFLVISII